ncbi:TetR/AcrR family transcriptional regulator [Knoellia subterranea]|uniref:TetR family transcriptional regulator n=1 Tax=Knoellia subterranea KCTC 19937 TaxID=1385521 RepID=A0A0A0JL33_9MICO|nr:TetR/AcrR family transcriptional regulator C-terminal domain-containing protein [Knoellia subterranea]KGN38130.1 TetR family transcriptional regulator [Knoellia subterranea KCTC 19937]
MTSTARSTSRRPLSRDRVLRRAVKLADTSGLAAVSMRRLGQDLGVEAMSLYNHVKGKEALLDAMVEHVGAELNAEVDALDLPDPAQDWAAALRARSLAARVVMLRHPWMPTVLESRTTMSLEIVRYYDGVVAILTAGGFDHDLTHHCLHALGSRVLGFTQELFDPGDTGEDTSEEVMAQMAQAVPNLMAMLAEVAHDEPGQTLGWCDDQTEFEFGLDVLLDGLERRRVSRTRK